MAMEVGTLFFPAKKSKALFLLLGSAAFCAASIWMIQQGESFGWVGLIFFGLGIPLGILMLLPNSMGLRLTLEGFAIEGLFKPSFTRWEEVTVFEVGMLNHNTVIVFNYTAAHTKNSRAKAFSKSLNGFEAMISPNYGHSAEELCELLNEWRFLNTVGKMD